MPRSKAKAGMIIREATGADVGAVAALLRARKLAKGGDIRQRAAFEVSL